MKRMKNKNDNHIFSQDIFLLSMMMQQEESKNISSSSHIFVDNDNSVVKKRKSDSDYKSETNHKKARLQVFDNEDSEIDTEVKGFTFDSEIDGLGNGSTDCDVAAYVYKYFCFRDNEVERCKRNQIIATSGKKLWFSFQNGKWNFVQGDIIMGSIISNQFRHRLQSYQISMEQHCNVKSAVVKPKYDALCDLMKQIRRIFYKKVIIQSIFQLCVIENFEEKLDANPYLVCCSNGVIDLKNKCFRDGRPSDMCSLSTNIDYHEDLRDSNSIYIDELDDYLCKVFPHKSQRDYVLNHIASSFYGNIANQSFNFFTGGGSNGKSKVIELIGLIMGDYMGYVPLQIITQKRPKIGGTSSEIMALKGKRYAVIQEPSKRDTINEGVMKELTGGDMITARALFRESVSFRPMFDLVICCNNLLNIASNDDGTWRRIKVVDFISKFVDNNACEEDFIFQKDLNLDDKFHNWKECFFHKLIQIAFHNEGKVGSYKMIQDATERYRKSQDKVGQYIEDMVVVSGTGNDFVLKTTLSRSFKAWCKLRYNYSIEADDLFKRLDETYDSDKFRYKGFIVNGLEEELVHESIFVGREEEFIKAFERKFVVTLDCKNDFVKRSDIQLWCKEINLRVSSTQEISKILLKRYNIDCSNREVCKPKNFNKISHYVIFGLKAIEL